MWAFLLRDPEGSAHAAFLTCLLSIQKHVNEDRRKHDGEDAEKKNECVHDGPPLGQQFARTVIIGRTRFYFTASAWGYTEVTTSKRSPEWMRSASMRR